MKESHRLEGLAAVAGMGRGVACSRPRAADRPRPRCAEVASARAVGGAYFGFFMKSFIDAEVMDVESLNKVSTPFFEANEYWSGMLPLP